MSRSKPKILMDSNSELQDRMGIEDQKAGMWQFLF